MPQVFQLLTSPCIHTFYSSLWKSLLDSGLGLWLALVTRMRKKGQCASSQTRTQESWHTSAYSIVRKTSLSWSAGPRRRMRDMCGRAALNEQLANLVQSRTQPNHRPEGAQPRLATPSWEKSSATRSADPQSTPKWVSSTKKWLFKPLSFSWFVLQ